MQSNISSTINTQAIADYFTKIKLSSTPEKHINQFSIPETERIVEIREIANDIGHDSKLKVASVQIKSEPGAFAENTAAHIAAMQPAFERKCDLVQFPEMSLPKYCSLDLLLDHSY